MKYLIIFLFVFSSCVQSFESPFSGGKKVYSEKAGVVLRIVYQTPDSLYGIIVNRDSSGQICIPGWVSKKNILPCELCKDYCK